jgi:hypothetical protein
MAHRSVLRADQLDPNDSFSFAQVTIDGYSGGDINDGYLTGLVLTDGDGGSNTLEFHADDGEINQIGSGQVSFTGNVDAANGIDVTGGNLIVDNNAQIKGDLTVQGTTTFIDTDQMVVTDPITIINIGGNEALSDWTGLTMQDTDGYNRIGWLFDGYWGLSTSFNADAESVPDRAIAFLGAGETNGDLSSTGAGDSGASKIGIESIAGLSATNVQDALEELNDDIDDLEKGTDNINWHINQDATPAVDEDPCLILSGGSGTRLVDGYLCTITDDANGDRMRFRMYSDGTLQDTVVHLGELGDTTALDAYLAFNTGDGGTAYQAQLHADGTGDLIYTTESEHIFSSGDVLINNDLQVDGYATLGNVADDHLIVNATIYSDLNPQDCTHQLGDDTHRWLDGYFCLFTPTNYTPVGSNNSLEGHLKGIDNALISVAINPPRGVYDITNAEAAADTLDTSRAVDQGDQTTLGGFTDEQFRDNIFVYWNGQLLWNDPASAANKGAVQNDVARQTGSLNNLLFAGNLKNNAIIQIVDLT